jgi:hypothetical protein
MSIEGIVLSLLHGGTAYLQLGDLLGNEGPLEFVLDIATGGFSLVLFAVTLYAWRKRGRQPTLLIVSFGFLTFFLEHAAGLLLVPALHGELFRSGMDFLTLSLFFVALVVRPRRNMQAGTSQSKIGQRE